jgi:hypothetical protein
VKSAVPLVAYSSLPLELSVAPAESTEATGGAHAGAASKHSQSGTCKGQGSCLAG